MPDNFLIEIKGLEGVLWRIKSLPKEAQNEIIKAVCEFALKEIQIEPAEKFVSRKTAYPEVGGFFSEKQRQFVSMLYAEGEVPYHRTHGLQQGWSLERTGDYVVIRNTSPGAEYVMGVKQSRHEKMVGWRKITDIIDKKLSFKNSVFRDMVRNAVRKAIGKLNLG
jgi:hypothetical protein